MGRQVQGQVRRRLGQVSRAHVRARQSQGVDPAGRAAHAAPGVDGLVGLHPRRREALPAPPDGSVRRVHRARRLQRGTGHRRDRAPGQARQHADLLHLGRQRFLVGGPQRHHQRAARAKRHSDHDRAAHHGVERARRPGCARRPEDRQHVPRRVGLGGQHALPGHQAHGRLLRRHAPADGRLVAEANPGRRRGPAAVSPRDRHRADDLRTHVDRRAPGRQRLRAGSDRRRQHGVRIGRSQGKGTRKTQFFDIMASRGIYNDGWFASAPARASRGSADFRRASRNGRR